MREGEACVFGERIETIMKGWLLDGHFDVEEFILHEAGAKEHPAGVDDVVHKILFGTIDRLESMGIGIAKLRELSRSSLWTIKLVEVRP